MPRQPWLFLCALLFTLRVHAQAPDTVRYALLIASLPSGVEKDWVAGNGSSYSYFEFNDRGRGPAITEHIVLGAGGVPTLVETTGHDYYKNAVAEHYTLSSGRATWQNSAEHGQRAVSGPAFYVSMDAAPQELAVLARALLAAPDGSLPLLPDGEARIARVGDLTVHRGSESRTVVQYAITGLDLTPTRLWLDTDGQLFASGYIWFMAIRDGWDAAQPELIKAQQAGDSVRQVALAHALAHQPNGPLVFRHADLFDAETGRIRARTTVVVKGNRIVVVGPDARVAVPSGAEVVDATGKTLLPGLWDMHVHTSDDDGLLHLAAGVTSVRDMANDLDELQRRRHRWDDGSLLGPRMLMAGFMDGPGPFRGPTKVLVSTDSEARAWIDRYAAMGYIQTKAYSSIDPKLVPVIVDESHRMGLRVSGHIPNGMTAEQAVREGFDEIQHANFWFLNFWDSVGDTRTPVRFTSVAERGALLDLNSERVRAFIQLLKERHTTLDPTVGTFEQLFVARKGVVMPGYDSVAPRLPSQVRRSLLAGGLPIPEGMDQRYRDSFEAMLKFLKLMYDAGIPIEAGTDAWPLGFAYDRELELYAEAGIPPAAVLQIATINAARITHRDSVLGSVTPGKLADLIIVAGHPAERISDIRRVRLVIKDGVVYEPAALYRAVGVRP